MEMLNLLIQFVNTPYSVKITPDEPLPAPYEPLLAPTLRNGYMNNSVNIEMVGQMSRLTYDTLKNEIQPDLVLMKEGVQITCSGESTTEGIRNITYKQKLMMSSVSNLAQQLIQTSKTLGVSTSVQEVDNIWKTMDSGPTKRCQLFNKLLPENIDTCYRPRISATLTQEYVLQHSAQLMNSDLVNIGIVYDRNTIAVLHQNQLELMDRITTAMLKDNDPPSTAKVDPPSTAKENSTEHGRKWLRMAKNTLSLVAENWKKNTVVKDMFGFFLEVRDNIKRNQAEKRQELLDDKAAEEDAERQELLDDKSEKDAMDSWYAREADTIDEPKPGPDNMAYLQSVKEYIQIANETFLPDIDKEDAVTSIYATKNSLGNYEEYISLFVQISNVKDITFVEMEKRFQDIMGARTRAFINIIYKHHLSW
jgi:hypothetical protein